MEVNFGNLVSNELSSNDRIDKLALWLTFSGLPYSASHVYERNLLGNWFHEAVVGPFEVVREFLKPSSHSLAAVWATSFVSSILISHDSSGISSLRT
ncbi:hypothetical protein OPV22_031262 [Ensete ventricosum]|uniref:Uncharacterized protein n=1 Tax=Ensete ventricosum TaxID=4639 RepID=A0AAV8NZ73_ENSVE|nr:hypothetical protein OPV22_031262 [Ensete ventricosum]